MCTENRFGNIGGEIATEMHSILFGLVPAEPDSARRPIIKRKWLTTYDVSIINPATASS